MRVYAPEATRAIAAPASAAMSRTISGRGPHARDQARRLPGERAHLVEVARRRSASGKSKPNTSRRTASAAPAAGDPLLVAGVRIGLGGRDEPRAEDRRTNPGGCVRSAGQTAQSHTMGYSTPREPE
ncbi:hypothetical protein [Capillimicrobium parvum]|uniref:hypothetical protein n=1 Tax=Capillimicrobium parvum TaxID=2884022 RepID=UPI00216B5B30|nr:hypothetical protein [Capillimicrobium parvum]